MPPWSRPTATGAPETTCSVPTPIADAVPAATSDGGEGGSLPPPHPSACEHMAPQARTSTLRRSSPPSRLWREWRIARHYSGRARPLRAEGLMTAVTRRNLFGATAYYLGEAPLGGRATHARLRRRRPARVRASLRAVGATPACVLPPFARQQRRRRRSDAVDVFARAPRAPAIPGAVAAARLALRHRRPAPAGRAAAAPAERERRGRSALRRGGSAVGHGRRDGARARRARASGARGSARVAAHGDPLASLRANDVRRNRTGVGNDRGRGQAARLPRLPAPASAAHPASGEGRRRMSRWKHIAPDAVALAALPLTSLQRQAAEAHASGCPDCARALRQGERVLELFDAHLDFPAPSRAALQQAMRRTRRIAALHIAGPTVATVLASAGVLAALASFPGEGWRWAASAALAISGVALSWLAISGRTVRWTVAAAAFLSVFFSAAFAGERS